MTLADISAGKRVRILKIRGSGSIRQRLLDMGISRGEIIRVDRYAPLKDPIQISFKSCSIALRVSEGKMIDVEPFHNPMKSTNPMKNTRRKV